MLVTALSGPCAALCCQQLRSRRQRRAICPPSALRVWLMSSPRKRSSSTNAASPKSASESARRLRTDKTSSCVCKGDVGRDRRTARRRATQLAAEQAAFIDRALGVAPSAEVVASAAARAQRRGPERRRGRSAGARRATPRSPAWSASPTTRRISRETVPYIGAATAHSLGAHRQGHPHRRHRQRRRLHARGVSAVPGTQAAYEAAWAPLPLARAGDSGRCRRAPAIWSPTIRAPRPTTACSRAPR